MPAWRSFHAQVDPAGPPPTTITSACCKGLLRRRFGLVLVMARQRHIVVAARREHDLVELQGSGLEPGRRSGEVQAPGADELLSVHSSHLVRNGFEVVQPGAT